METNVDGGRVAAMRRRLDILCGAPMTETERVERDVRRAARLAEIEHKLVILRQEVAVYSDEIDCLSEEASELIAVREVVPAKPDEPKAS